MKKFNLIILFLCIFFSAHLTANSSGTPKIALTPSEKEWIKDHPFVTLGADNFWPPMDFKDTNGSHIGFDADILSLLNDKIEGLQIRVAQDEWGEVQEMVKKGKIQGLIGASINTERQEYLDFSNTYLTIPGVIFTEKGTPDVTSIDDLKGKKVAVKASSAYAKILETEYPEVIIVPVPSTLEAIYSVSFKEADYGFGMLSEISYQITNNFISNIKATYTINDSSSGVHIALRKDQKVLLGIINKALADIPAESINILKEKWINLNQSAYDSNDLSIDEKIFLGQNKEFRIAILTNIKPLTFEEDRALKGIAPDFMADVVNKLRITPNYIKFESVGAMKNAFERGEVDVLSLINSNTEVKSSALVTSPYIESPLVIVTGENVAFTQSMNALKNKKVAIVRKTSHIEMIKSVHPEIELVEVVSPFEGVQQVINGDAYAFIGSWLSVGALLQQMPGAGFHVSGITPYSVRFSIGVQKSLPLLYSSIQKALASIPKRRSDEILSKWTTTLIEHKVDYESLAKVIIIFATIVFALLMWVKTLSAKVKTAMKEYDNVMNEKREQDLILMRKSKSTEFGDMFLSAKHQWIQPLNVIYIECQNIAESFSPIEIKSTHLAKEVIESVEAIEKQVKLMDQTVEDFRDVYSGHADIKEFSLAESLNEIVRLYSPVLIADTIALETEITADAQITGLPSEWKHALLIILNNAKNALLEIERNDRYIYLRSDIKDNQIIVCIEDSGGGIAKDLLPEKLFQPFVSTNKTDSSGIGLAVCKKIIEETFKGTITAENINKGARFTIRIPLKS